MSGKKGKGPNATSGPLDKEHQETMLALRTRYSLTQLVPLLGCSTETIRKAANGVSVSRSIRRVLEMALAQMEKEAKAKEVA